MNPADSFKELCEQVYGKRKLRSVEDEDFRDDFDDSENNDEREEYD